LFDIRNGNTLAKIFPGASYKF